ncbi:pyocin activator PrtN family protein [Salmonella enterica]|uniref:Pyocin activator protein PrtN n=1 Tax=Salmonella enterica subsp. VII serovar 40:z4,z24:[z39] TaxID=1967625 RepID=A0A731TLW9_SALEE|nr:pyocin activator protein PrtN [Salmonella enterica]EDO5297794.1 pyocin activator protein PrtN [Salmonella enterica subsp. houtenae serovar 40:z4,z24:-]EEC0942630.1 pyocin activator protein PrtN [Salmonella enterica subsp. enterica serovar Baguida]QUZ21681.1 pyocin activator PrtN family protein [Salmonella enterica subsp. VII str. CFSAN000554]HAE4734141.1 pyocin activator protein PrtN [Salmonella enterica subsp. VII serovar 40:z4,z24:[z39]]HCA3677321.1 pyocin activator PrtN family protein [S
MNTLYFLMAEFETVTPALADISEKYLGMKPRTAEDKAVLGKLPLPTFRVGDTQKAPRLVHLEDLANHIDKMREESRKQHADFYPA